MRKRIEQKEKADGIRTGVWLMAFCAVLGCMITIRLSPRYTGKPTPVTATESLPDQDSSPRRVSIRSTAPMEFTSMASGSGANDDVIEAQLTMIEQVTQDRGTWMDSPDFYR